MNIKEALKKLTENGGELYCKICTVDAVNETARTVDVTPLDESAPILGVNLQANQNGTAGLVTFPEINSHVVVAFLNDAAAVVVLAEKITKVCAVFGDTSPVELEATDKKLSIKIGNTTITADEQKNIQLNGDSLGGLVVIQELQDSLNSIKTYCETMKTAVSAGIKAVGAAAAANGATGATAFDTAMSSVSIKIKKMENDKIKHGN